MAGDGIGARQGLRLYPGSGDVDGMAAQAFPPRMAWPDERDKTVGLLRIHNTGSCRTASSGTSHSCQKCSFRPS